MVSQGRHVAGGDSIDKLRDLQDHHKVGFAALTPNLSNLRPLSTICYSPSDDVCCKSYDLDTSECRQETYNLSFTVASYSPPAFNRPSLEVGQNSKQRKRTLGYRILYYCA